MNKQNNTEISNKLFTPCYNDTFATRNRLSNESYSNEGECEILNGAISFQTLLILLTKNAIFVLDLTCHNVRPFTEIRKQRHIAITSCWLLSSYNETDCITTAMH